MATTIHDVPDTGAPLVNRDDERAALRNLASAADRGDGQLVLLGGEAGSGKTTPAPAPPPPAPPRARRLRLMGEAPPQRLILPRLRPVNVTEMVTAQFGTGQQMTALSRSVYRTTAGNPLFVREMCRALVSTHAVRQTEEGWAVVSTT